MREKKPIYNIRKTPKILRLGPFLFTFAAVMCDFLNRDHTTLDFRTGNKRVRQEIRDTGQPKNVCELYEIFKGPSGKYT